MSQTAPLGAFLALVLAEKREILNTMMVIWMLTFVAGLVTILEYGQAMHGKTIDEVVRD